MRMPDDREALPAGYTSLANPYVKHLLKLRQSASYRREQGSCVVVGGRLLSEYGASTAGGQRAL